MAVGTVAGCNLYIAQPGTPGTYTVIHDISNLGDINQQFTPVKVESIDNGDDYEIKGTRSFPAVTVQLNRNVGDPGQDALRLASLAARGILYNFKLDEGDTPAVLAAVFTVTVAAPGVFTSVAHGLNVGDAITLSTTGALPTGLLPATTYYVKTAPTADTFTVAATSGGTAITTTGTQSGVHTFTTVPSNSIHLWKGEVFGYGTSLGGANNLKMVKTSISIRPETYSFVPAAE